MEGTGEVRTETGANGETAQASVREIERAATELAGSASELGRIARSYLDEQARTRPYAVLGAAAGIGFVLGGGLASRGGSMLLSLGARWTVARLLEGGAAERR